MKFIEKNLEDIIFDHIDEMEARGLNLRIYDNSFINIQRQVKLGAYGIADLILTELYKLPCGGKYIIITVIECKKGIIDINAYQQVKRYKAAIEEVIRASNICKTEILINTALIGDTLNSKSDFVFVLNDDSNCSAYLYNYGIDGIEFKKVGRNWKYTPHNLPLKSIGSLFKSIYQDFYNAEQPELELIDRWGFLD